MSAATDADGDWWLTREPRSSLHSTEDDSKSSIQQRDRYMLKDGSEASVTRLGHRSRRFVYHQHRDADEDGAMTAATDADGVEVVQRCTAGTVSSQELSPAAPRRTRQMALRRYQSELVGVHQISSKQLHRDGMKCLNAEEECHGLPCQRLPRDPTTPEQKYSHHQWRAGCRTSPLTQQSSSIGKLKQLQMSWSWS